MPLACIPVVTSIMVMLVLGLAGVVLAGREKAPAVAAAVPSNRPPVAFLIAFALFLPLLAAGLVALGVALDP